MIRLFYTFSLTYLVCFGLYAQKGGGCRDAISITSGVYIVDSMIRGVATFSTISPNPTKAKWYKYVPPQDGLLNISSCAGGADSRLFVYTGNCDTMSLFGYNDDYCTSKQNGADEAADVTKFVKAGKTYFLEWDNAWDTSAFSFVISLIPNATVAEAQSCKTAKTINAGLIKVDSLFGYASHGDAGRSNWYKFIPKTNGKLTVSTCGVDVDTRLWLYKGSCDAMTTVAESDDDCDGTLLPDLAVSLQNILLTANTPYYLEWDDTYENNPFEFVLQFDATTAIEDATLSRSIALAPNPASEYVDFQYNFERNTDIQVSIINPMGQIVLTKKMTDILRGGENINIKDLHSGLYIVRIMEGTRIANKKLVISK